MDRQQFKDESSFSQFNQNPEPNSMPQNQHYQPPRMNANQHQAPYSGQYLAQGQGQFQSQSHGQTSFPNQSGHFSGMVGQYQSQVPSNPFPGRRSMYSSGSSGAPGGNSQYIPSYNSHMPSQQPQYQHNSSYYGYNTEGDYSQDTSRFSSYPSSSSSSIYSRSNNGTHPSVSNVSGGYPRTTTEFSGQTSVSSGYVPSSSSSGGYPSRKLNSPYPTTTSRYSSNQMLPNPAGTSYGPNGASLSSNRPDYGNTVSQMPPAMQPRYQMSEETQYQSQQTQPQQSIPPTQAPPVPLKGDNVQEFKQKAKEMKRDYLPKLERLVEEYKDPNREKLDPIIEKQNLEDIQKKVTLLKTLITADFKPNSNFPPRKEILDAAEKQIRVWLHKHGALGEDLVVVNQKGDEVALAEAKGMDASIGDPKMDSSLKRETPYSSQDSVNGYYKEGMNHPSYGGHGRGQNQLVNPQQLHQHPQQLDRQMQYHQQHPQRQYPQSHQLPHQQEPPQSHPGNPAMQQQQQQQQFHHDEYNQYNQQTMPTNQEVGGYENEEELDYIGQLGLSVDLGEFDHPNIQLPTTESNTYFTSSNEEEETNFSEILGKRRSEGGGRPAGGENPSKLAKMEPR